MQSRKSIINLPLLIGSVLSIAVHVAALYHQGNYTPPKPQFDTGLTVVQLTLNPSIASRAEASKPEPIQPEPEQMVEPIPTPEPVVKPEHIVEQPIETRADAAQEPIQPEPEQLPEREDSSANSNQRDSTLIVEKGVIVDAEPTVGIQPRYPRVSQRRGEEGIVTLSVQVFANGKKGEIKIVESSGHQRLDDAARKAVLKASFLPAQTMGQTVESTIELSFVFELTDD